MESQLYQYKTYLLSEVVQNPTFLEQLKQLTIGQERKSWMHFKLRKIEKKYKNNQQIDKTSRAIVCFNKENKSVGWILITGYYKKHRINVFVEESYRRQGIGKALVEKAKEIVNTEFVYKPFNEEGQLFFQNVLSVSE